MRISLALALILNLILAPLVFSDVAYAEPKIPNAILDSEKLKGKDKQLIPDQYIVVLKNGVSKDKVSNEHGLLKKIHKYDNALNGFALKASASQIEKLKNDDRVLFVEQDSIMNITAQSLPTGIDRIDADLNPTSKIDGIDERVDVDVAIIDTGIYAGHPDLNVAGGINFVGSDPTAWNDGHGHGTHVAGTVAGLDNDIGVAGVAPGARVWAVKVLSDEGWGYRSDIIEGIDWVTANADVIDVVNMSIGGSGSDDGNCGLTNSDSYHYAICNSVSQGVVYVVAAGNSVQDSATFVPAAYDEVITVSAVADFDGKPGALGSPTCRLDVDDTFADFSNYGADVDIAAPGVCILSSLPEGYGIKSGTSMASPHVAGAAALFIVENGKPVDAAGTVFVKSSLIDLATPQNSPEGFSGDPDVYAEPLLNARTSFYDTTPPSVFITNPTDGSTVEGIVTVSVNATDDVGISTVNLHIDDTLYDQKTSQPYDFSINSNTLSNGYHEIIAIAIDSRENSNFDLISFTVANEENTPPVLTAIADGDLLVDELTELSFTATATDADIPANLLTFSLDAGAPAGANIDANTGVFSWTPTESQGPGTYAITVRVTDDGIPSLDDSETITVTVNEVNDPNTPPVLTAIADGDLLVDELTELSFTATATDADIPANSLTFSLDAGAPAGANIDANTGVFSWTPTESQGPGTYAITIRVTDDGIPSLDDSETITVTVNEVNDPNTAPVLTAIGNQAVDELSELSFTATATDADIPANSLTFSLDAGAPTGSSIDTTTGLFSWTPTESQGPGKFAITVRVTDDGIPSLDDSETITVTVKTNPRDTIPPSISITDPPYGSIIEGITNVSVDATDTVGVTSVELFVNGILHDTMISSPYDFTVNADDLPTGTNIITAKAFDSRNNFSEVSINVLVENNSLSSSISITNPTNGAQVNGRLTIIADVSDFAATPVVKFFIDGVLKETDDSPDYKYGWHTKDESIGTHIITAEATDSVGNTASTSISVAIEEKGNKGKKGQAADLIIELDEIKRSSEIFEASLIELNAEDEQPFLASAVPMFEQIEPQTLAEGDVFSINVIGSDSDGHNLSFPIDQQDLSSFAQFTDNGDATATVILSPGFEDAGEYSVTITATDDDDPPSLNSIMIMITVTDTSVSPELSLIDAESTNVGLSISVPFSATDSDVDDVLSFSTLELPEFVELVDNGDRTGSLEISPGFEDVGVFVITVTVSDNTEPEPLTDTKDFTLTVLESTPSSVVTYLQTQKALLSSEDIKNLGEKVSFAAKLHNNFVGATKQERSDYQDAFHDYINEAKNVIQIGQGMKAKMILQDISKMQLKIDAKFKKLNDIDEKESKVNDALSLKAKKAELADIKQQMVAIDSFIKRVDEKEKKLAELEDKQLALMKEIMVDEIKQSNKELSEDEINEIAEQIDQTVDQSAGKGNGGNNGKENSEKDNNSSKGKSSDKSNNSSKGKSSDKSNNGNKGGNGKSKK